MEHHRQADDDDMPELSSGAFAALQEFYSERENSTKRFEDLKARSDQESSQATLSMNMFSEDWNASQFWYSDDTATLLAKELLEGAQKDNNIAVVSAPSVFIQLKNLLASGTYENPRISLLEFDKRFDVFEEFVHYDFQKPLNLPGEHQNANLSIFWVFNYQFSRDKREI
ncbi:hypothetical protein MMC29_003295 [Sticta canariensis]|nr:hypothetical protein [Sticta canariensis]